MHEPLFDHVSYLKPLIRTEELRETLQKAVIVLKRFDFDAIAFRGISGTLIGPPLALALDKTMILVRKPETYSHSAHDVEGDIGARTYVIVDDIISSGATVDAVVKAIKKTAPKAVCIGVLETTKLDSHLAYLDAPISRPLSPTHAYDYWDTMTGEFAL